MTKLLTICTAVLALIILLTACQSGRGVGETAVIPTTPASFPTTPPTNEPPKQSTENGELITDNVPAPTPQPPTPSPQPPFSPPDIHYLQATIQESLAGFPGVSSYTIIDLQTGEQISHNADVALAGTSLIKIPLLIETFRALDRPPDIEQTKLLTQTTAVSSNFAANLLLRDLVGGGDIYRGLDTLNQSLRDLGVYNTFIAVPYDMDPPANRPQTYLTPANQRTDLTTQPDPFRQTTLADLARLMTALYTCAEADSGLLRAAYPDQITQSECQEILSLLTQNELARLLQNSVPEGVTFSQKVGWIDDTHGNIGIVFGPERDYLIGMALYAPGWLEWEDSAPLFEAVSRLSYAHFNEPNAYSPEILAQPPVLQAASTPVPTPDLPQAIVFGTQGMGLTLRSVPGGSETAILPEGAIVSLLNVPPQEQGGLTWRKIRTTQNLEGWVGELFLTTSNQE